MLETTDLEIDVSALLRRVRRLAHADPGGPGENAPDPGPGHRLPALPPEPPMPPGRDGDEGERPPGTPEAQPDSAARFASLLPDLIARAEAKTRVDPGTPGFMRPLRRNQGGFNGILVEIVQELVASNVGLAREISALRGEVGQQSRQLTRQSLQLDAHHAWIAASLGSEPGRRAWAEGLRNAIAELAGRAAAGEQATRAAREETAAMRELVQGAALESGRTQREWPGWKARVEDLATDQAKTAARCDRIETRPEEVASALRTDLVTLQGNLETRLDAVRGELETLRAEVRPAGEAEAHAGHLRNLQGEKDSLQREVEGLRAQMEDLGGRMDGLGGQVEGLRGQVDAPLQLTRDQLADLQGSARTHQLRLDDVHAATNRAGEHLRSLQGQADHLRAALDVEIHAREALHGIVSPLPPSFEGLRRDLERLDERQIADGSFLKAELALNRRPASFTPAPAVAPADHPPGDGEHALDAFYVAFENEFRGSRDLVRERLRVYLPDLERVGAGSADRPVLDLGCGRGEWLELLRENGHAAVRGVDLNGAMVAECQARGLDVQLADALALLRGLPADSLGAVTAFHLIEHLPFPVLLDLLAQTHRVLRPGGLAIFESPNCKNLVVGGCNFYSDPTHRNPVFPDTAGFMLRAQGFARAEVRYLRPVEGSPFDPTRPDGAALHGWFFGPRDFAVLGHKGGGASPTDHAGA